MNEKKYKRLEYLRQNIDFLTIRERQEYYELLNEFNAAHEQGFSEPPQMQMESELENEQGQASGSGLSAASRGTHSASNASGASRNRKSRSERSAGTRTGASGTRNASSSSAASSTAKAAQSASKFPKKPKLGKNGKKKHHWVRNVLVVILLILVVMGGFFAYGYSRGVKHEGGVVKAESFTPRKNADGTINILLLGADQRPWQSSGVAHTDTIMVLHLDPKNHTTRLVSFMRDTLVNIPGVGHSSSPDVKINTAFTIGEQDNHTGVNLMSTTLNQNFGINCQYYAVVDFSSFATIIDSLFPGGLQIDAKFSTVNGKTLPAVPVPDDLAATEGKTSNDEDLTAAQAAALGYPDGGGTFMMIKPGVQKMNGRMLLNYARFRHDDEGDAGRVKRQQQVMSTVLSKLKNPLALFTGSSALGTTRAVTMTNIPNTFLLTTGISSLLTMKGGLQSTTIPANGDWQNAYDMYGGIGLSINMTKYKAEAEQLLGQ